MMRGFAMCKDKDMAIHVLQECYDMNIPINNISLQRVLRDIQIEYPDKKSVPHFDDEPLMFGFGPIYPDVYTEYRSYLNRPITCPVVDKLSINLSDTEKTRIRELICNRCPMSMRNRCTLVSQESSLDTV